MSEKKILERAFKYFKKFGTSMDILLPPGDDCAAIELSKGEVMLLTADQVIEEVHYRADEEVAKIARKVLARNLSDIAGCGGGKRIIALCTVALSTKSYSEDMDWFSKFFKALSREAKKFKVCICGGDIAKIAKSSQTVVSMTIVAFSKKEKVLRRDGARDGDLVLCTGELGNSFASGHHLDFVPRLDEADFLSDGFANCMIDISDGLVKDSLHIAEASGGRIAIDLDALPLRRWATIESALSEGEDYELLFLVSKRKMKKLLSEWRFKTKISVIGEFKSCSKVGVFSLLGEDLVAKFAGFDHWGKGV